jgi:hypothetical protein
MDLGGHGLHGSAGLCQSFSKMQGLLLREIIQRQKKKIPCVCVDVKEQEVFLNVIIFINIKTFHNTPR